MQTYVLKTIMGETINKTKANNKEFAIQIFAKIKHLAVNEMLKIYSVEKAG